MTKILTFEAAVLFLLCNIVYCENFFNTTVITSSKYTVESLTKMEIKTVCKTLDDCSENALECKFYGTNKTNSYCVYPDYICSNAETCYQVNADNVLNKDLILERNYNENIFNCTYDHECQSNQCVSGQCLINTNSTISYCNIDDKEGENTRFKCASLIDEKCDSNDDCITSACDPITKTCIKKRDEDSSKKISTTTYVVIGIGIICGFIIFIIVIWVFYESFQYLDQNPELQEFRKENRKAAAVVGLSVIV